MAENRKHHTISEVTRSQHMKCVLCGCVHLVVLPTICAVDLVLSTHLLLLLVDNVTILKLQLPLWDFIMIVSICKSSTSLQ